MIFIMKKYDKLMIYTPNEETAKKLLSFLKKYGIENDIILSSMCG